MKAVRALAIAELRMLTRDSVAWSMAIALPLLLGVAWLISAPPFGEGWSAVVALQVMVLLVLTLHTVGTMVLASRRQQQVLKRWRGSGVSDLSILTGTLGVPAVLVLVQATVLVGATWWLTARAPVAPVLVVAAVLTALATVGAFTFVSAAFTRSAEHATVTTLPLMVALLYGTYRGLTVAPDRSAVLELAIPGFSATQLIQLGWDGAGALTGAGGVAPAALQHLAASAVLVGVAVAFAVRTFRWDPRS